MTTNNITDPITLSTEIHELNDDELESVAGGSAGLSPSQQAYYNWFYGRRL
jgi:bacteriocin-like protein